MIESIEEKDEELEKEVEMAGRFGMRLQEFLKNEQKYGTKPKVMFSGLHAMAFAIARLALPNEEAAVEASLSMVASCVEGYDKMVKHE